MQVHVWSYSWSSPEIMLTVGAFFKKNFEASMKFYDQMAAAIMTGRQND